MDLVIREGRIEDTQECAQICFDAFWDIATEHNFQPDFPSVEATVRVVSAMLEHEGFYCAVAERNGEIVGSNFLDERAEIVGLGPITVLRQAQNEGVGQLLLGDALERSDRRKASGVRLVQAAYHGRSMALYLKQGFEIREPLAAMRGTLRRLDVPDHHVRAVEISDLEECRELCQFTQGFSRNWELQDAISAGNAFLAELGGRVSAYTTNIGFGGHTVGRDSAAVMALVSAADRIRGSGFLLPLRSTDLLMWCLKQGLRIEQPLSLMSRGSYREPQGVVLPSIAC
ncbi:MAG: GNAT family N-acetyltransferase [Acidimicrobiaceae bacterium]|nr:GNAT family N-acetyltransferase [Acidimicrobiaceae bacterium]|tara:strand:- start:621 stop:1478 length:858 start_codon:yes stop_codon:yes gene_type:complete